MICAERRRLEVPTLAPATWRGGCCGWRSRGASRLVGDELAQHRPLAAADRQALDDAVEHYQPVGLVGRALGGPLEAADRGARHQAVAVNAHKLASEF